MLPIVVNQTEKQQPKIVVSNWLPKTVPEEGGHDQGGRVAVGLIPLNIKISLVYVVYFFIVRLTIFSTQFFIIVSC
jgi:hypothetical protein